MKRVTGTIGALAGAAALALLPVVVAHGDDMGMDMEADQPGPDDSYPPTYFSHPEHQLAIYTHIALMVVAWVFILPPTVMLSIARSRYTLILQFVFVLTNAFGVLVGTIYNANTPDLYPNNAHHRLGWIVTWVSLVQVLIGLLGRVSGKLTRADKSSSAERQSFIPVATEPPEEHENFDQTRFPKFHRRLSDDSGHGTDAHSESARGNSLSSGQLSPALPLEDAGKELGDHEDDDLEAHLPVLHRLSAVQRLAKKVAGKLSSRTWTALQFVYNFVDRTVLLLGSISLATGAATFGRFFEGSAIFNGLAHWIKGGVFVWMGIFTLGRWAGSFGDLGWAWNIRPRRAGQKWRPSAEFVESALIFVYGSTNIFLEHLGGWGGAWTAQDLEHISITVLFIGGGLCGMLIESTRIRDLLNTTITEAKLDDPHYGDEERTELAEPRQYSFSLNPIPALVILLLGKMMGSHTQGSMLSTMVHKQWGDQLTGAAIARALTYVITYLKPPKSIYPSRPPTELLTSFGLIAGGFIFMASSSDTVDGMIHYELDAMFVYTVTMGFVGLLMAWVIFVISLKGWAVRKETRRFGTSALRR
ncbi:hypothetical protein VTK73DRAFT_9311 [Phialemonium thermophilum]|uniref:Integral membrane protein n=1 Tax=Phialemonium thermophilum TaxID=223376 RepID=A0ABR3W3I7_9PEZI